MAARLFLALLLIFIPIQAAHAANANDASSANAIDTYVAEQSVDEQEKEDAQAALDATSTNANEAFAAEQTVEEQDGEDLVPAKEALEKPQKWVNIILVIIFLIAGAAFLAIFIVMKRSAK